MVGYWNKPEETANTKDEEGWLYTGDIAKMDEDGYFYIVDRKKDLIIASGYNIVPREVEEVLFEYPKVLEAVVVGIPDPKRGETVKAYHRAQRRRNCHSRGNQRLLQGESGPVQGPLFRRVPL